MEDPIVSSTKDLSLGETHERTSVREHLEKYSLLPEIVRRHIEYIADEIRHDKNLLKTHTTWKLRGETGLYGKDLVNWLLEKHIVYTIPDAIEKGQLLIDGGYLKGIKDDTYLSFYNTNDFYHLHHEESESAASILRSSAKSGYISELSTFRTHTYYAIASNETNKLYLYESDLDNKPQYKYDIDKLRITHEESYGNDTEIKTSPSRTSTGTSNGSSTANKDKFQFQYGNKTMSLKASTKEEMEEWIEILTSMGAIYREALHHSYKQNIETFYDLMDRDLNGNIASMKQYQGKVCLVVTLAQNASNDKNMDELIALYHTFENRQFMILGFPDLNFSKNTNTSKTDVQQFIQKYQIKFPMFEKAPTHGNKVRPVIAYLQEKLPLRYGLFARSDYRKYLINQYGKPVKVYTFSDRPSRLVADIQDLLND